MTMFLPVEAHQFIGGSMSLVIDSYLNKKIAKDGNITKAIAQFIIIFCVGIKKVIELIKPKNRIATIMKNPKNIAFIIPSYLPSLNLLEP